MSSYVTRKVREQVQYALAEVKSDIADCREKSLAVTKLEEADMWLRQVADREDEAEMADMDRDD